MKADSTLHILISNATQHLDHRSQSTFIEIDTASLSISLLLEWCFIIKVEWKSLRYQDRDILFIDQDELADIH